MFQNSSPCGAQTSDKNRERRVDEGDDNSSWGVDLHIFFVFFWFCGLPFRLSCLLLSVSLLPIIAAR
jgi:hypothetical protein